MEKERDHFTFFKSFREQIDLMPEKDQLSLYRAIADYALLHKDTKFTNPMQKLAWIGIKPILENSWVKYLNSLNSKNVPKPNNKGNKNASKTKPKQSENEPIEKDSIGEDSIVSDKLEQRQSNYGNNNRSQDNIMEAQNNFLAEIAQSQSIPQTDERSREVHEVLPFGR